MAKKVWYSVPLKLFWDEVYPIQKRLTPLYSDEQIYLSLLHQNATAPYAPTETEWDREHFRIGLDLWWADYNGELLHIFYGKKIGIYSFRDFFAGYFRDKTVFLC